MKDMKGFRDKSLGLYEIYPVNISSNFFLSQKPFIPFISAAVWP